MGKFLYQYCPVYHQWNTLAIRSFALIQKRKWGFEGVAFILMAAGVIEIP